VARLERRLARSR